MLGYPQFFLLLKAEVILMGPSERRYHVFSGHGPFSSCYSSFASSNVVRNLGVLFDREPTFNTHIQVCYFSVCETSRKIRKCVSFKGAEKRIRAFVKIGLLQCHSFSPAHTMARPLTGSTLLQSCVFTGVWLDLELNSRSVLSPRRLFTLKLLLTLKII